MYSILCIRVYLYICMCVFTCASSSRALALCQFPSPMMCLFVHHVLTVPACVLHLHVLSPEVHTYVMYIVYSYMYLRVYTYVLIIIITSL